MSGRNIAREFMEARGFAWGLPYRTSRPLQQLRWEQRGTKAERAFRIPVVRLEARRRYLRRHAGQGHEAHA